MTFPFGSQCILNAVFRLIKALPWLCSITAPDRCKLSVLTFIVFEFKISVPPNYYMKFTFVYCRKLTERYGLTSCVAL